MGDGDAADAGDVGGPDFAPVTPAVESSAFGAPPANRAAIVPGPGPGYRGRITLPRTAHQAPPPPPVAGSDPGNGAGTDPRPAHHEGRPQPPDARPA
ncbi:hypothetical protein GA0070606_5666 [Micromonospora citrea]|uniref:Uncharacterized protein n=1 Tax=Micromonospora citrea TaxID=47855 RepID=A0A1C6VYG2_9ACTN|nr:hypothetical protein GA0070606_5666 [Micromonospora citrea]